MKASCRTVGSIATVAFGLALLVVGLVVLLAVYPEVINNEIDKELTLRNGSDAANRFVKSPSPVYFKFYLFNVTNMDDVNSNGSDAVLQQLGPYVFREDKIKEVSDWDEWSGTVSYKVRSTYHFDQEKSTGKLSDVVNHINAVSIGMVSQLEAYQLAGQIPNIRGNYVETHTADELIFSGFKIDMYFPVDLAALCPVIIDQCKFAYYYERNGTTGEEYEVSSGVKGMTDYTEIKRYMYKPELTFWYGDSCNMINGTDGQQFPPHVESDQNLYVFSDDVCRSLMFNYEQQVKVQGINCLRYVMPPSVFADPNKNKDNMCFCQNVSTPAPCESKAGVISLEKCQGGKPVMASNPHFYQGELEYWQKYKGLNPNKTLHETYLDVEPLTGTVLSVAKRLQINIKVVPDDRLKFLNHITNVTYFPAFWVEEGGEIDPDSAADFRRQVLVPEEIGKWGSIAAIAVGAVILFVALVIGAIKYARSSKPSYAHFSSDEVDRQNKTDVHGSINQGQENYGAT